MLSQLSQRIRWWRSARGHLPATTASRRLTKCVRHSFRSRSSQPARSSASLSGTDRASISASIEATTSITPGGPSPYLRSVTRRAPRVSAEPVHGSVPKTVSGRLPKSGGTLGPEVEKVILTLSVRDLVFVSWEVSPEQLAARLPEGLEPELADGRALVTLSFARAVAGRLGRLRVPRFTKLTVHSYVTGSEGPGLCFLESRVSRSAYGRRLVGIPFATTRLRVRPGLAEAPELGASIRYRADGETAAPQLDSAAVGQHEAAYFESGVLFRLVARGRRAFPAWGPPPRGSAGGARSRWSHRDSIGCARSSTSASRARCST